jgi:hypothetical protein
MGPTWAREDRQGPRRTVSTLTQSGPRYPNQGYRWRREQWRHWLSCRPPRRSARRARPFSTLKLHLHSLDLGLAAARPGQVRVTGQMHPSRHRGRRADQDLALGRTKALHQASELLQTISTLHYLGSTVPPRGTLLDPPRHHLHAPFLQQLILPRPYGHLRATVHWERHEAQAHRR